MFEIFFNFVEWFGTIAILGAYGLSLFHVLPFGGKAFMIMNLAGSVSLVIGGAFKRTMWNNVVFYLLWAIITVLVFFNPLHWVF